MGRTPTRNKNLPSGMRARHRGSKTYFYLDTGATPRKEIPLGSDYALAVQKWAELTVSKAAQPDLITFRYVAERYIREVLPTKAPATQRINLSELKRLYVYFDSPPAPINTIEPRNIRMYMDLRKGSPVSANREKALFSHIFNFAREKGLTSNPNPCAGIKGNKEKGRDVYIDNSVFAAVWAAAETPLQDAMDLAYLTGQRPADVLKFLHSHIVDDELNIQQNKRGKRLRIKVNGELAKVIQRINDRSPTGGHLIQDAAGQGLPSSTLRSAFQAAREAAIAANPEIADQIAAFQFRDLRAKAGTDKEEASGIAAAQDQLGHSSVSMTARYVRHRRGKLIDPTK
jgi:integrase